MLMYWAAARDHHGVGHRRFIFCRHQKMHRVGHEAVGMHGKALARRKFLPQDQVELVILRFNETGFAVIPTLNHMIGKLGAVHPCTARHGKFLLHGRWRENIRTARLLEV